MTMENFWTIIASLAAVFSAAYSYHSNQTSKKALKYAKKSYQDKQANFHLYLIDSFRWALKESKKNKLLLFHCTINNKSENKSSYKATLELEYIRDDNSVSRVIIDHDSSLLTRIPKNSLTAFSNDIRIEEKGMESKWLVFEQPEIIRNEYRIEKYSIIITDIAGNLESIDCYMLKDIRYENN
jgi:hypothetical protein